MTTAAAAAGRRERNYFLAAAATIAALVFVGFARTYYLRGVFGLPPLPVRLHVHGAAMTAWVLTLALQVGLVRARRVEWHRTFGWLGAAVALLVVVLGCTTTLHAAAREVAGRTSAAMGQLTVLGLELTQMALFAGLVTAAVVRRRQPADHKRLMVLATLCLLPSPIARLPISFDRNEMILLWFDFVVLTLIAVDCLRIRRLHPANGWGAALLLGGLNAAYLGAYTTTWRTFAAWLVS